jgi:hypothetical protein
MKLIFAMRVTAHIATSGIYFLLFESLPILTLSRGILKLSPLWFRTNRGKYMFTKRA